MAARESWPVFGVDELSVYENLNERDSAVVPAGDQVGAPFA
jgi:hypothetical protein